MNEVNKWVRANRCDSGSCVEVGWKRSSRCTRRECVEVFHVDEEIHVRDSKLGERSPILRFSLHDWKWICIFLDGGVPLRNLRPSYILPWRYIWKQNNKTLHFSRREIKDFINGVKDGDFERAKL